MSVVYYLQVGDTVKIGTSRQPDVRFAALRCGFPAVLLATEPGGQEVEYDRHRQFGHLRLVNEVFRLAPELLRFIAELDCIPQLVTTGNPLPERIRTEYRDRVIETKVTCRECAAALTVDQYDLAPVPVDF